MFLFCFFVFSVSVPGSGTARDVAVAFHNNDAVAAFDAHALAQSGGGVGNIARHGSLVDSDALSKNSRRKRTGIGGSAANLPTGAAAAIDSGATTFARTVASPLQCVREPRANNPSAVRHVARFGERAVSVYEDGTVFVLDVAQRGFVTAALVSRHNGQTNDKESTGLPPARIAVDERGTLMTCSNSSGRKVS